MGSNVASGAEWLTGEYGAFVRDYPSHPHAGEALFKVAQATWATAGYPEVFGYIFTPDGWPAWRTKAAELEVRFDTGGFGGGSKGPVLPVNRDETLRALAMFKDEDVVARYPTSPPPRRRSTTRRSSSTTASTKRRGRSSNSKRSTSWHPSSSPLLQRRARGLTALRRGNGLHADYRPQAKWLTT